MKSEANSASLAERAPELARHLAFVRGAVARNALGTGLVVVVPIMVAWLVVVAPLDWSVELPRWARALFLVAALGGSAFAAWRFGIRQWLEKPSDEAVALRIEKALPSFRSRLIASIQLSRESDDGLVRALVRETTQFADSAPLRAVVDTARFVRWAKIGGALVLAVTIALLAIGKPAVSLLKRAFLVEVPVPRKTSIVNMTGSRVIALGDDIRIEATVGGAVPAIGKLHVTTASGRKVEFTLDPTLANRNFFLRTLQSVQETFSYTMEIGDNRTQSERIEVRPRPSIVKVDATQFWPEYSGAPPRVRPMTDLKILAGSKLGLRLKSSSDLRSATVRFLGADKKSTAREVPMKAVSPTEWEVSAEVPAKDSSGVAFHLVDAAGVESKSGTVYRLEVVADAAPSVRILWPVRREELVTRAATLLVSFEAKDDYGVAKVRLHYGVNWNDGAPHQTVELDLDGGSPKAVTRRFEWHLERLAMNEGDIVEFWLEAIDGNTATGPGVGLLAEHYQARVVSDADKRADLASRLDDTIRGVGDVKEGQEHLSKRLGEMIQILPGQ